MVKRFIRKANQKLSLSSAAGLLIFVAMTGQLLGFLRNRLISTNFTVIDPGSTDAFFAAFQIPDFFFYTIAAGALGVAFIPFVSDKLEKGDRKGMWELVTSLLNTMAILMILISLTMFIFADPIIRNLFPGLPAEHTGEAITIMRLISFNPLFFTISGVLTAVQQTFGRFFFYAVAPITYNLAIIVSIYLFKDSYGVVGLGIGALAGAVLQVVVAGFGLLGLGFSWRPKIMWGRSDFKQVLHQLPARSIDQGIDSVNSIVEINRAAALPLEGAVSYYTYALTLHNVPIMLIGTSIATAAFPRLTERLSQNRPDLFRKDFLTILRTMIWITMPILVISYFGRGYLARLLFGQAAPRVALLFGFLVVAIFFRIVYAIISRYFYAQKDTMTPLIVSIFAIGLNIYLAFTLAKPSAYGLAGLAIAQSLVAFAEVIVLSAVMVWRDRKLLNLVFWDGIGKILSVTGFTAPVGYLMIQLFPLQLADTGLVTLGAKLGLISVTVLGVHLMLSSLFSLEEVRPIAAKARQLILRPARIQ